MKDLQERQKRRATRTQRDTLDRALTDIAGFYRDVLAVQLGAPPPETTDAGLRQAVHRMSVAESASPERTLRRIEAVLECRRVLDRNVAPLLAVEAMTLALWKG
jgi:DNA polymerase-3 subunit delta'